MKVFIEKQKFTQWWLHLLITLSSIIAILLISKDWINTVDKSITANSSSLVGIISIIALHFLIYTACLKTKINDIGISYKFIPFHFTERKILWKDIDEIYIRKYNPILEYGGWGLRFTFNKNKGNALNISGDIGIQIVLKNGKKLLIGTQKEDDITRVLNNYQKK
ncbi:hypothetical protein PG913_09465 [Tenacibaculum pacificus]|uniref:hypothetical protein n=1 Tax=Tenacibaculum pacificus TaxID=3018314 RepID=UPI0022F3AA93|nr:hypothetical protein [Tenacibaculum pacificus]WBX73107.1 hypothetical protein PG913_09465 [Tenacibaculum pacificus]